MSKSTVSPRGFEGFGIDYLADLEETLNFKCTNLVEYVGDRKKFRGFNGFTLYFADCAIGGNSSACKCDLGISAFTMTATRIELVDFVTVLASDSYSAVQKRSGIANSQPSNVFFLAPFTPAYVPLQRCGFPC